jgi:hypothetical protein
MPSTTETPDRRSGQKLALLFWAGVGLAPLAALLLVIGSGTGSLRAAVGLVLLSIVLMGLSLALRPRAESVRVELEDTIFDEIDILREDVRADITTAARATHRQFGEKFQYLQDTVEHMRANLDAMRAELHRAQQGVPHHPAAAPHGSVPPPGGRPTAGPGVVRHTETVQVTTRSTIVDPHADDSRRGGRPGSEWGGRSPQPTPRDDHEESWTEQKLRERLAGNGQRDRDRDRDRDLDGEIVVPRERFEGERDGEDRWAGMRSGDRWASVRSDDRGRELRVGERRAAVHSDDSGTEMRIEDRWAAVRREDRRERERDEHRRDEPRRDEPRGRWSGADDDADWDSRDDRDRGYRALPASSDEPSASEWVRGWSQAPEPDRRRY